MGFLRWFLFHEDQDGFTPFEYSLYITIGVIVIAVAVGYLSNALSF